MKTININENWYFHIEDEEYIKTGDKSKMEPRTRFQLFKPDFDTEFSAHRYEHHDWDKVTLPHDYVVELDFDPSTYSGQGHKPVNDTNNYPGSKLLRSDTKTFPISWYRREFFIDEKGEFVDGVKPLYGDRNGVAPDERRYIIEFEGVYRDYIIFVNGTYIDRINSGYIGTTIDITDQILYGETNTIVVRVDASQFEGWWYDGAGIYRNVNLMIADNIYCLADDLFVKPTIDGKLAIEADFMSHSEEEATRKILWEVLDGDKVVASRTDDVTFSYGKNQVKADMKVDNPKLWSPDEPNLYKFRLSIDGKIEQEVNIGFKLVTFDKDKGMFLNGKNIKLNGTCMHQDLFGVGSAVDDELAYFKIKTCKDMGINAYRTAHNPPSKGIMDACDKLGILVMEETRAFGSTPEALRQVESMVKRDRNRPSVLFWSIGNEEVTQNTEFGKRMATTIVKRIKSLDDTHLVTYGANCGSQYKGINEVVDVRAVNYIKLTETRGDGYDYAPDRYHDRHPEQPIFSSEEVYSWGTRGIYKNDYEKYLLDSYCESGATFSTVPEEAMKFYMNRDYFFGIFVWSAFDYHGEPAPFHEENYVGHGGITDLCGIPKDIYYYYKAWWKYDEPLIHLFPHWNHELGEEVRVMVHTNCDEVSLYLNGKLISTVVPEKYCSPEWMVKFEPGELKAVGKKDGKEYVSIRKTAELGGLSMTTEKYGKYHIVDVFTVDKEGELFPLTYDELDFSIENGEIIAAGAGDPTSTQRECFKRKDVILREITDYTWEEEEVIPPAFTTNFNLEPRIDCPEKSHLVWRRISAAQDKYKQPVKFVFDAKSEDEFIEFYADFESAKVYVNGEMVADMPNLNQGCARRKRRVYADFVEGKNEVVIEMISDPGTKCTLSYIRVGSHKAPDVSYKLFSGVLRLIVKPDENCVLSATNDELGLKATINLPK